MSNRPQPRTQRYSRPPSLSTIGSNEEADFSTSRRNRQTFQSSFSVSPLEEYLPNNYFHSQASANDGQRLESRSFEDRSAPLYSPAYEREQSLSGHTQDKYLVGAPDEEKGGFESIEKPDGALTKSSFFIIPEMERSNTGFSVRSQTEYSEGSQPYQQYEQYPQDGEQPAPKKYMKTRFMWMLLQLDQIPWWHNLLAATSAWIILAAYLVVPTTFTNLSKDKQNAPPRAPTNTPEDQFDVFTDQLVASINNLGLLIFSGILAGVGTLMCVILFLLHWQNYVWLSWKIFQPMTLNALAGLVTTIVNVKTTQKGVWSITAKINASVTGGVVAIAGSLLLFYNFVLIERVRKQHRRHFPVDAELVDPMKVRSIGRYMPKGNGYS